MALPHLLSSSKTTGHLDTAAVAPAGTIVSVARMAVIGVILPTVLAGSGRILLAHALGSGDEGAEEKVLHDGQLPQDLCDEHAAHAAVNLGPRLGGGDVVEHGAVPAQALDRLCAVDELDLAEVEEVVAKLLDGEVLVDGARGDEGVVQELGGAEEEGQELVVVEAPDAVGAGGLEVVGHLDDAHEGEVAGEDAQDEGLEVGALEDAELVEAEEPHHKVELVAGAVVDAVPVAEGLGEVGGGFGDGVGVVEAEAFMPCWDLFLDEI